MFILVNNFKHIPKDVWHFSALTIIAVILSKYYHIFTYAIDKIPNCAIIIFIDTVVDYSIHIFVRFPDNSQRQVILCVTKHTDCATS